MKPEPRPSLYTGFRTPPRHLRFLMSTDSANAAAMDGYTQQHLAKLDPAFAAMYNDRQFPEEAAS